MRGAGPAIRCGKPAGDVFNRPKETTVTRLLDLAPRALERLRGAELVEAIGASEGRTIAAETITATGPLLDRVSNPELVAAFGADIIVLNLYDVDHPRIAGMPRRAGDAAPGDDATAFGAVGTGAGRTNVRRTRSARY